MLRGRFPIISRLSSNNANALLLLLRRNIRNTEVSLSRIVGLALETYVTWWMSSFSMILVYYEVIV